MKRFLPAVFLFSLALFSGVTAFSQIENPVKWDYKSFKTGDKDYDVRLSATIAPGWHLYAMDPGEGPEPTSVTFSPNPLIKLDGKVKEEGKLKKEYDKNFDTELKYFDSRVDFVQEVKLKAAATTLVKGNVTYMVCNDRKCLPPKTVPFAIKVTGK